MTRAVAVATAALAVVLFAGCGGGPAPGDVVEEAATRLGEIRSGTLDFSLLVTPRGESRPTGFELRGPFSFDSRGPLPVLAVEYTQVSGGRRGRVRLISTGRRAYAAVGRATYELTRSQTDDLRAAAGTLAGDAGLLRLPLDEWVVDPELSDGRVAGAPTYRVRGRLDIVATVNGLLDVARAFGSDLPRIDGASAAELRRATRATLFELDAGTDDRLLRRLTLEAEFALDVPVQLRRQLGDLFGAKVAFRLGVKRPNAPVTVEDPESAQPAAQLAGG
jgi:hypothetical protein